MKFRSSLMGRANGCGRAQSSYRIIGRSWQRWRRTWHRSRMIAPKRASSARWARVATFGESEGKILYVWLADRSGLCGPGPRPWGTPTRLGKRISAAPSLWLAPPHAQPRPACRVIIGFSERIWMTSKQYLLRLLTGENLEPAASTGANQPPNL